GKEKRIRIESSSGLSQSEIEQMRRDAESHAEEDRRRRELIDVRNRADAIIYEVEKALRDNAHKISGSDKAPIAAAIETGKHAASGADVAAIEQPISTLHAASHAMAQHFQKGGPQPGGREAPSGDGKGKDDVIDAEFEVKK